MATLAPHELPPQVPAGSPTPSRRSVILLAESDREEVFWLRDILSSPERDLLIARTAGEVERLLEDHGISLIVLGLEFDQGGGLALLARLRSNPQTALLPVLVLSTAPAVETEITCQTLGIDGFFMKPVDARVLSAAVQAKLQREEAISRLYRHDPLTGLPNRGSFRRNFERSQVSARRERRPLSLALLDIDRFKSVNDIYGHMTGDRLLRHAAMMLTLSLRAPDVAARWGGEEFVVLFPGSPPAAAVKALRRTVQVFRSSPVRVKAGDDLVITFSAGVTEVGPEMPEEQAVAEADRWLLRAKEAGRGRVCGPSDPAEPAAFTGPASPQ